MFSLKYYSQMTYSIIVDRSIFFEFYLQYMLRSMKRSYPSNGMSLTLYSSWTIQLLGQSPLLLLYCLHWNGQSSCNFISQRVALPFLLIIEWSDPHSHLEVIVASHDRFTHRFVGDREVSSVSYSKQAVCHLVFCF